MIIGRVGVVEWTGGGMYVCGWSEEGCVFCLYFVRMDFRMCLSGRVWYDMGMFCLILWFCGSVVLL